MDPEKPSANKYQGIYEGVVTQNADTLKLGRIKARIPGIMDDPESVWALPVGNPGSGTAQRGFFDVPNIGSEIYMFFLGGDPDKARFFTGHWGIPKGESEIPTQARDALDEDITNASKIKVYETDTWVMVFDEREEKERMFIKRKRDIEGVDDEDLIGGNALMFELDATAGTFAISAPGGIVLRSLGMIDLDASVVQIAGRKVANGIVDGI